MSIILGRKYIKRKIQRELGRYVVVVVGAIEYQSVIDVTAEFVLHSPKMNSIQYRNCTTGKSGPGGI